MATRIMSGQAKSQNLEYLKKQDYIIIDNILNGVNVSI